MVTATEAALGEVNAPVAAADVTVEDMGESGDRPRGARFGILVHSVLSDVPLGGSHTPAGSGVGVSDVEDSADPDFVTRLTTAHGRMLGADDVEVAAAARIVRSALAHPLLQAAARAAAGGHCFRETPITCRLEDGSLVEGTADLAFDDGRGFVVIDFKTDRPLDEVREKYVRQVGWYVAALTRASGRPARGVVLLV